MRGYFSQFYKLVILRAINGGLVGYISLICLILLLVTGFMKLYVYSGLFLLIVLSITVYLGYREK